MLVRGRDLLCRAGRDWSPGWGLLPHALLGLPACELLRRPCHIHPLTTPGRAAWNGDEAVVRILVAAPGVNVNARESKVGMPRVTVPDAAHTLSSSCFQEGWTPLHFAACNDKAQIITLLRAHPKLDLFVRDFENRTALDVARMWNRATSVVILEAAARLAPSDAVTGGSPILGGSPSTFAGKDMLSSVSGISEAPLAATSSVGLSADVPIAADTQSRQVTVTSRTGAAVNIPLPSVAAAGCGVSVAQHGHRARKSPHSGDAPTFSEERKLDDEAGRLVQVGDPRWDGSRQNCLRTTQSLLLPPACFRLSIARKLARPGAQLW